MRLFALVLIALPGLLPTMASAQATLNKCINAQGGITYSNLPCRDAQEVRKVEIDPAPSPAPQQVQPAPTQLPPAQPVAPKAVSLNEPGTIRVKTSHTTGKPGAPVSSSQCDILTGKLGRVFDKMDAARRNGYTQQQMNGWNADIKELEHKKQQSGCF
jgi:hypothetical protein